MKNIIMITTDQHHVDTLKIYNQNAYCYTPNLDQLAAESAVFERSYCTNPVCTPARSSWQLGLYPSKTGFETNSFEIGSRTHILPDVEYSLPRRLQKAGYRTGFTGKWHLGLQADKHASREGKWFLDDIYEHKNLSGHHLINTESLPSTHGYEGDDFEGHGLGGWKYPQYEEYLNGKGIKLEIEDIYSSNRQGDHTTWGLVTSGKESTVESFLLDRSKQIIESLKDDKFYMQINFWGPHEPYYVPKENFDKFKDLKLEVNPTFNLALNKSNDILRRKETDWDFFETASKYYFAYVEYLDEVIGKLIAYLKAEKLYDNTVIIFTSDHGNYLGGHGQMENKSYGMYEDIMRVPLLIKDGENIGNYHHLTNSCDIYETILDYANVDLSEFKSDGRSIKKIFDGSGWEKDMLGESMGAFPMVVTQRMYLSSEYKYIYIFGGSEEIYNLSVDKNEQNNLADDEALLHELRALCYEKMKVMNDPVATMFAKCQGLDY